MVSIKLLSRVQFQMNFKESTQFKVAKEAQSQFYCYLTLKFIINVLQFHLHSFLEQKERDTQLRSYIAYFSVHQIFFPIIISTKYIQNFLPEAMMTLRQSHQNSYVFIKAHYFFVSLTLFFQYVSFQIMMFSSSDFLDFKTTFWTPLTTAYACI